MIKTVLKVSVVASLILSAGNAGISDGLVAHYEFEGNANDSSGNGNNGTEYGGVGYVDGVIGKAGSFDGMDNYISRNIDVSETKYSVSVFFKTTSLDGGLFQVGDGELGVNGHDRHIYLSSGKVCTRVWSDETICTGTKYDDNSWHNIVHKYDGTKQYIYVDGSLLATGSKGSSDFDWQTHISIGFSQDAYNKYFNGLIDDLRIYNRALSDSEIKELYNLKNGTISSDNCNLSSKLDKYDFIDMVVDG
ncbi:MAG: LamG domain-containing protein, partial [Campylobacterales bacterium]|nr:LamG domain-containing protein [Campylobacterales bacterium]